MGGDDKRRLSKHLFCADIKKIKRAKKKKPLNLASVASDDNKQYGHTVVHVARDGDHQDERHGNDPHVETIFGLKKLSQLLRGKTWYETDQNVEHTISQNASEIVPKLSILCYFSYQHDYFNANQYKVLRVRIGRKRMS